MQKFKVSELMPHPQNEFFFDDMEGQKWKEFLESVRTSGIIEPPVVTAEGVIVSGHQRIRACKELGIDETFCEVRKYDDEDKVVKDLIETNIRQRGTIAGSELKMGRVWEELKRIYGVKNGNNQHGRLPQDAEPKTQPQIAKMLGKSVDTLERFSELQKLIPEFQTILEEKKISPLTASSLVAKLSEEEQMQLFNTLPAAHKYTQTQVKEYIDKNKGLEEKNKGLEREKEELQKEVVDAVRAAKSNEDGKEYLRMKDKLEEVQEERRKYYEKWREATSKPTGVSESDVRRMVDEAKDSVKAQYQKLTETLQKKVNELEDRKPDVREVEVIPSDYEELKQAKAELDIIKTSGTDISKQILRIHTTNITPEQKVKNFESHLLGNVGNFLIDMRGLEVELDLCGKMSNINKGIARTQIAELQQILMRIDNSIMEGTEACITA